MVNSEPRISIFVCDCGGEISKTVDVNDLKKYSASLPNVVSCVLHSNLCSSEGLEVVKHEIKNNNADRVIIAACSPRIMQKRFENALAEVDLNRYMLERANIREQCAWVHDDRHQATTKAKNLVKIAHARAELLKPLEKVKLTGVKSALVVGGGIAGIRTAYDLSKAGYHVTIVEKRQYLGGKVVQLYKYFPKMCPPECGIEFYLRDLRNNPLVDIYTNSEIVDISGNKGNYKATIKVNPTYIEDDKCINCDKCVEVCPAEGENEFNLGIDTKKAVFCHSKTISPFRYYIDPEICIDLSGEESCTKCEEVCPTNAIDKSQKPVEITIDIGAVILATGWEPYDISVKSEYGYGILKDVITNLEMERYASPTGPTHGKIIQPSTGKTPKTIAFIQCAGSRDINNLEYCSNVCCMATLKQIQYIYEQIPDAKVYVFYMDIRSFRKEYERFHAKAQELGAVLIRGNVAKIYENTDNGSLRLRVEDTILGEVLEINSDLVVLATGMVPSPGTRELAEKLNIPLDEYGFIVSHHIQCFPLDTRRVNLYAAGACTAPMDVAAAIQTASGAAMQTVISTGEIEVEPNYPSINKFKCDQCKRCIEECPFGVYYFDEKGFPEPDITKCRQCGICLGSCPLQVVDLQNMTIAQMQKMIEAVDVKIDGEDFEPSILGLFCINDAYAAADLAGSKRLKYPPNIRIIPLPCSGSLNTMFLSLALTRGIDGVLVAGCPRDEENGEQCHYVQGDLLAKTRIANFVDTLQRMMVESQRVKFVDLSVNDADKFVKEVENFRMELKSLGPNIFKPV